MPLSGVYDAAVWRMHSWPAAYATHPCKHFSQASSLASVESEAAIPAYIRPLFSEGKETNSERSGDISGKKADIWIRGLRLMEGGAGTGEGYRDRLMEYISRPLGGIFLGFERQYPYIGPYYAFRRQEKFC